MTRVLELCKSAADWTEYNPVLAAGQVGVEKGTNKFKVGNGTSTWAQLKYGSQTHTVSATATLDFPATAAGAQSELTVTVTGAAVGDTVILGPPAALEAGLAVVGYVSAADTVKVRVLNVTGSSINPASASWKVSVLS